MKRLFIIFMMGLNAQVYSQGNFQYTKDYKQLLAVSKDQNTGMGFESLLSKFKKKDQNLTQREVLTMMIGYTDTPLYKPYAYYEMQNQLQRNSRDGSMKEVYAQSKQYLEKLPFSLSLLNQLLYAAQRLGYTEDANSYRILISKLVDAMKYSGTGENPDKAIFILEPADANFFLGELRSKGYKIAGKTNINNGEYQEVYEYQKFENGPYHKIYFNLQHSLKANN